MPHWAVVTIIILAVICLWQRIVISSAKKESRWCQKTINGLTAILKELAYSLRHDYGWAESAQTSNLSEARKLGLGDEYSRFLRTGDSFKSIFATISAKTTLVALISNCINMPYDQYQKTCSALAEKANSTGLRIDPGFFSLLNSWRERNSSQRRALQIKYLLDNVELDTDIDQEVNEMMRCAELGDLIFGLPYWFADRQTFESWLVGVHEAQTKNRELHAETG